MNKLEKLLLGVFPSQTGMDRYICGFGAHQYGSYLSGAPFGVVYGLFRKC